MPSSLRSPARGRRLSFNGSADSICSTKDGECAAKETRTD